MLESLRKKSSVTFFTFIRYLVVFFHPLIWSKTLPGLFEALNCHEYVGNAAQQDPLGDPHPHPALRLLLAH